MAKVSAIACNKLQVKAKIKARQNPGNQMCFFQKASVPALQVNKKQIPLLA
ncbi:hypothetical protein ACSYAD_28240 [Acaryochloris marina NIES-2412]|uniref:hypothetical protein n=1 Tax=Acaryochloris marina TaxID=155978 RepID=UPI00405A0DA0